MDFLKRIVVPPRLKTPIPISTVIDGVELSGEITYLAPNDMSVVIHSPVSGLGTSLHVPYFAMHRIKWLATNETIDAFRGSNAMAVGSTSNLRRLLTGPRG